MLINPHRMDAADSATLTARLPFEAMFMASPVAASVTRLHDGRLLAVNQAWVDLTGVSRERAIGRTTLELVHPDDRAATMAAAGIPIVISVDDGGRFLQWLEGPAESVDRIWQSIRVDSRHTDVEILGHMPTTVRCFPDWGMKLGDRDPSERPDAATLIGAAIIVTCGVLILTRR